MDEESTHNYSQIIAFINPLSNESQEILKEKGDLNEIFNENEELIKIVNQSEHQNINNNYLIPNSYANLSIKRLEWYIERKNNKNFKNNDFSYILNENLAEIDVLIFHMLSQAIANKFNVNSRETRLFLEAQEKLIEERLRRLRPSTRKIIVDNLLNQLILEDNIRWTSLNELIDSKKLSLHDLIIDQGDVIINKEDFINRFEYKFTDRVPDRIYDVIIGENTKELILTKMIVQNTENYIKKIKKMSNRIEIHPNISKLSNILNEKISKLSNKYSNYYSGNFEEALEIEKLQKEAFPPCISNTIEGVKSGGRNDAIVLLLTSFVSYARLYPSIFRDEGNVKVSDIDKNLSITLNEILPIIYEAADNCNPPLFEDQPQEKINIISKLGFGMHDTPKLENEGETKWYTPMSCEKIKIHLPQICKPDKRCKHIGNPLSYYSQKKWQLKQGKEKK